MREFFFGRGREMPEYGLGFGVNRHQDFLRTLETHFKINLSASKDIEPRQIADMYSLVSVYNGWLWDTHLCSWSGNMVLMTEEDHRALSLAFIDRREQEFIRGLFGATGTRYVGIRADRNLWKGEDIPAGQHFAYEYGDKLVRVAVITQYHNENKGENAKIPLEAKVAEEMLHGVSSMASLSPYLGEPTEIVHATEELAVKYYVDLVMRQHGLRREARIFRKTGDLHTAIDIWRSFIRRVGRQRADHLFFHGYGGSAYVGEDWNILMSCVVAALKKRDSSR